MRDRDGLERLDVMAALLSYGAPRSDEADAWVDGDRAPLSEAEHDRIRSATDGEWALAVDLAGGPEPASDPGAPVIADLLRLASRSGAASLLRAGLRQAFLLPDDSADGMDREERTDMFTELYKTLALPGLSADARALAGRLLGTLRPGG